MCWCRAKTKAQKYEKISEKKLSTPVEELCSGAPGKQFVKEQAGGIWSPPLPPFRYKYF